MPAPYTTTFNSLKTLTLAADADNTPLRRCVISRTSLSSNDNTILDTDEAAEPEHGCWGLYGRRRKPCLFPPAIPLLARTGNLSCHMPWVLKRIYRDDGSLVIQEVPVKHHEYFRASRDGGRLTLQHVYLDDKSPIYEIGQETHELRDEGDDDQLCVDDKPERHTEDQTEVTVVRLDDDDDDKEQEEEDAEKIPPSPRFSEIGDSMNGVELPAMFLNLPPINISSSSLPEPLVLQNVRRGASNIGSPILCTRCQG